MAGKRAGGSGGCGFSILCGVGLALALVTKPLRSKGFTTKERSARDNSLALNKIEMVEVVFIVTNFSLNFSCLYWQAVMEQVRDFCAEKGT